MVSFLFIVGFVLFVLGLALLENYNDRLGVTVFILGSSLIGTTISMMDEETIIVQLARKLMGVFNG